MIGPRSTRDRERIDYEVSRAIRILVLVSLAFKCLGRNQMSRAVGLIARDLTRARDGQETGFDRMGGRNEWLLEQKKGAGHG